DSPLSGEAAIPGFRSAVESPQALMARVREILDNQGSAGFVSRSEGEIDLRALAPFGAGWFAPEQLGRDLIRWTSRRFEFEATAGRASHVLMEVCLFPESGLAELRMRLRVNDSLGGAARVRTGWNRVHLALPANTFGPSRFSVDAGGSWCPADSRASGDSRELAVAV